MWKIFPAGSIDFSLQRPTTIPDKAAQYEEKRAEFRVEVTSVNANPNYLMAFEDEVHFFPQTTIRRAWLPIGSNLLLYSRRKRFSPLTLSAIPLFSASSPQHDQRRSLALRSVHIPGLRVHPFRWFCTGCPFQIVQAVPLRLNRDSVEIGQ